MDVAGFSIKKSAIIWLMIVFFMGGGIFAYDHLSRYEDPEFTIKDAKVVTFYPGATPREVEQEVTDRIEKAIQRLDQIKRTTSISEGGKSEITVTIKDKYSKHSLPQVWDELRRKVGDAQSLLPPGAGPSMVNDDFGDVYGMLFAILGEGFSYKELKTYADIIKRDLELVPGVAKVQLSGVRDQAIFVEISRSKLSQLGISLEEIYATLASQNMVVDAGDVRVGDEYIVIRPSGTVDSVAAISNLLIKSTRSGNLIYLNDIATVFRGYVEVPDHLVFFNGERGLSLGISVISGGNVVKIGEAVDQQLQALESIVSAGIVAVPIYQQPKIVRESIKGFLINLLEALAIVMVVLLLFMGLRSGLIIAAILLLTVLGTLFFMYLFNISLERISLGALVIALGMLVDNAIVVTEGVLVKVQKGFDAIRAGCDVVEQTLWPLLAATIIGILAFAAIGLSPDATGEYTRSLFYVILISLMLSWLLAITVAPLFCHLFLKQVTPVDDGDKPLYQGIVYRSYKGLLLFCLRRRQLTIAVMLALLALAVYGFGMIKDGFFPDSTTPMFYVDYWRAQGTDIRATQADMQEIEQYFLGIDGVVEVTTLVGQGAQRFMLVYTPESPNSSYGQFLVRVQDYRQIDAISEQINQYMNEQFPDSEPKIRKIRLGPGKTSRIEARFSGPDETELRRLANQAEAIMRANPNATAIRNDWRQQVKVIRPQYSEMRGRLTGGTRADLSDTLLTAFAGKEVGLYRERDELIPIISRSPENERLNVDSIEDVQIWSPLLEATVPIMQLVSSITTDWEDARIHRRNRKRTITASADPILGAEASVLLDAIMPAIEAIPLPPAYQMEWGGEYEDAINAQTALAKQLPFSFIAMFAILVILFNSIRQPLVIWFCVPLSIIGITAGLLLMDKPFDFMALLGFLSLTGMLIKNAIVLVDQIGIELRAGKAPIDAIVDSAISRARPVFLAAVTTVLGMLPLLTDAFFVSMAVVIMFGLSFATLLTLLIVPVLYAVFFRYSYTARTS